MRLEQIRAFCLIVEAGSFTRAAERLHVTQPAISVGMRQLEEEFGGRLIDRRHGRLQLTALGEQLYPIMREVMDRIHQLEVIQDQLRSADMGNVTVALSATASSYFLAQLLPEFRARFPDIQVTLRLMSTQDVQTEVLSDRVDIGVLLSPGPLPRLDPVCHWPDELLVVVPQGHPWAQGVRPTRADLVRQAWILPPAPGPTRRLTDTFFRESWGTSPRVLLQIGNPEAIKRAILSAGEPGILLRSSCAQELALGTLVQVDTDFSLTCLHMAVVRRGRQLSRAARSLVSFLRALLAPES